MKKLKLSSNLNRRSLQDTYLPTKEEEQAKVGRNVEEAEECLLLMHSPKTAPTLETNLKYTHNKTSSNINTKVDELHLHEKISKLKSYYKSAQSLIADELSKKARNSKLAKQGVPELRKS